MERIKVIKNLIISYEDFEYLHKKINRSPSQVVVV